jgi:hypothetical protein
LSSSSSVVLVLLVVLVVVVVVVVVVALVVLSLVVVVVCPVPCAFVLLATSLLWLAGHSTCLLAGSTALCPLSRAR